FKNAAVAVTVTRLPLIAKKVLFGHDVNEVLNEEKSKSGDAANYVGYGFISAEYVKGSQTFIACFLPKVIFSEGEESYETQGDSIVFKTPILTGIAIAAENGIWREKKVFSTEEEADKWLQMKVNKIPQCDTPIASVASGVYSAAQNVTLSTTMSGVNIKYTTNGTMPTETNGTIYNKAIAIAATTGVRAIAYKANCLSSDIMTEEYFIEII
ncbi:MAG: chitobiase/beta-hexosaminidase C-terminal domain-containing protein, partial [Flavobacterium sp.]